MRHDFPEGMAEKPCDVLIGIVVVNIGVAFASHLIDDDLKAPLPELAVVRAVVLQVGADVAMETMQDAACEPRVRGEPLAAFGAHLKRDAVFRQDHDVEIAAVARREQALQGFVSLIHRGCPTPRR